MVNHFWIAFVAPPLFTPGGFLVAVIPGAIVTPLFPILVTVLYINLRVEKEGLDAQALADSGSAVSKEPESTTNSNSSDGNNSDESDTEGMVDIATVPEVV